MQELVIVGCHCSSLCASVFLPAATALKWFCFHAQNQGEASGIYSLPPQCPGMVCCYARLACHFGCDSDCCWLVGQCVHTNTVLQDGTCVMSLFAQHACLAGNCHDVSIDQAMLAPSLACKPKRHEGMQRRLAYVASPMVLIYPARCPIPCRTSIVVDL